LVVGADLPPVGLWRGQQVATKLLLARKAASPVRSGHTLLIDAGSTNSATADALPDRMGLTIVTTAPDISQRLLDREGFEILMIGGRHSGSARNSPCSCRSVFPANVRTRPGQGNLGYKQ
jgi:DeoR/GlpR family transcriptional regulator of sugar metabolism